MKKQPLKTNQSPEILHGAPNRTYTVLMEMKRNGAASQTFVEAKDWIEASLKAEADFGPEWTAMVAF